MSVTLDRLKAQLLISNIQQENQALYQVINQLIDAVKRNSQGLDSVTTSLGGGGGSGPVTPINGTYLTVDHEAGLPYSRQLRAGSGINIQNTPNGITTIHSALPFAIDGEQGEEGFVGIPGMRGLQGIQGIQGIPGTGGSGSSVSPMPFAIDGEPGEDGFGIPGSRGIQGLTGNTGPAGSSATGLVPFDAEEYIEPLVIPGPRGLVGLTGPSAPFLFEYPDEVIEPITLMGNIVKPTKSIVGPTNVPYNSTDFVGGSGQVVTVAAGDVTTFSYFKLDDILFIDLILDAISINAATGNMIQVLIPGGYIPVSTKQTTMVVSDNTSATFEIGQIRAGAGAAFLNLYRAGFAFWSASVDNTYIRAATWFRVQP